MKTRKLSDEQWALIPQVRDEWLKIGLDTSPVDSSQIREILDRLYALAGKPAPKNNLHLASPLQIPNAISRYIKFRFQPTMRAVRPLTGHFCWKCDVSIAMLTITFSFIAHNFSFRLFTAPAPR